MKVNPQVSFIVPCYNYARYLPDCLNSILALEGAGYYEIILIDDASTDNTLEVIQSFRDSRIRLIRHAQNMGHARTINEGLSEARGKFVARIDPDDRYKPHFLTAVLPKFDEHPEVGLVYGDVSLIDDQGNVMVERGDTFHQGRDFYGNELIALLERNIICAPSVLARREAWLGVTPVPEWLAFN
ncbi:MAG TPA: glycosyltransferase family 2 protein, partial [Acidobacteriota bacterium]|nr:glycosyltransferase family 2 protein [Acidobacteriota bacterium]